ncbi:MAG: tRNA adenosine(34) deaminase TadA [Firmicutes bacterium]|jgi:tRNA(adenine34) deaminase|nr:tRNA adenosine(34) deaminase TadA [Bacillota bacterium]
MDHNFYMAIAVAEAENAARSGEVPVGAVLIRKDGTVIARDHNRRESEQDPTAHAEILVLRQGAERQGGWRLEDTILYVTLEPCTMCAGALVLSRVAQVVFGARDPKGGALVSLYQLGSDPRLNHQFGVTEGVMRQESQQLLTSFFRQRR